jgi:hypothetical protein
MARVFALGGAARLSLPGRKSREIVAAASDAQNATVRFVEIGPALGIPFEPGVGVGAAVCHFSETRHPVSIDA